MNLGDILYKSPTGWHIIGRYFSVILDFINPLPDYKIKQIYNLDKYLIVWYWPKKVNGAVDQKIVLIDRGHSLDSIRGHPYVVYKEVKGCELFARSQQKMGLYSMYICTLPEPVKCISYGELIFITMTSQILVVGHHTVSNLYNLQQGGQSFMKFEFRSSNVRNIYSEHGRVFVHTTDGRVHASGYNNYGEMGINSSTTWSSGEIMYFPEMSDRDLKLKKIVSGSRYTLFWYCEAKNYEIYFAGEDFTIDRSFNKHLRHSGNDILCDIQAHESSYILAFQHQIEIYTESLKYDIVFDFPIEKFHSTLDIIYVRVNNELKIYHFDSTECRLVGHKISNYSQLTKCVRWFDTLPFAHDNWNILCTLFAGHYKCPDSPLSKAKLPMDLLKIIINALIDLY